MKHINNVQNILLITAFPTYGAGSGVAVTTLADSYKKNGKKVSIITANNKTNFEKLPGVNYCLVPFTSEEENPEKIEGQCNFNYLMFTTHTESTTNFWNATLEQIMQYENAFRKKISNEIKRFKPDIIHAQHNWISSSISTDYNIPVIVTIHGTDLMGYEKSKEELTKLYKELTLIKDEKKKQKIIDEIKKYNFYIESANKSARNSKKIIVISRAQKEEFEHLFPFAKNKIELVENGYNPENFYVKENIDKKEVLKKLISNNYEKKEINIDYDFFVLFVGKFADFKGIDILLDASKKYEDYIYAQGKKVLTIIVGSGSLEQQLKKQASDLNLINTHFVGKKGIQEICDLQNLADVSVVPSRNEPFGLVVLEGLACGHPVIGTNSGGIPDILNILQQNTNDISNTDCTNKLFHVTPLGILIPMNNSTALSQSICQIFDKTIAFDNTFIADYVQKNYSQENITQRILNIFESTIQKNNDTFDDKEIY